MRNKIKVALLACLICLAGCDLFQPKESNQYLEEDVAVVTQVVTKSADNLLASAQKIDKSLIFIKQDALTAKTQSPATAPLMTSIEKNANDIAGESSKLKQTSSNLAKAGVKLEISGRTIDSYVQRAVDAEKQNETLEGEVAKLEENAKAGLDRMLKWIIGACVVGAGACAAVAIFFGNIKGGLTGAAACIIIMTLAIAVSQYMMYIAIGGGLIVLGTFGVLGYQLFIQRRAISDNVWTQEVAKRHMTDDLKEKIYGIGKDKGQAGAIQSATTQKIIKNIKDKLPKGWHVSKKD
jgi:hypothetical protein